jgi:hypothetical protein
MSAPRWQRAAEAVYAAALGLYPRRIRERHGEEMRLAFRDRCREVSADGRSAWRLLGLEIVPDLAGSLASAHLDEPMAPRLRNALVAFVLLACAWLLHDTISKRFLDAWFTASLHYRHWQEQRAFERDDASVHSIADRLAASPKDGERAVAAYLYAGNFANRRYQATYAVGTPETMAFELPVADAERASRLVSSLARSTDVQAVRLSLATCALLGTCDRLAIAQALVQREPDNAYGWSQVLKAHSVAGNEPAVRADLHRLGQSRYYERGADAAEATAWSAARRFAAGDAAVSGALGRQLSGSRYSLLGDDDYWHDLMYLCALPRPGVSSWLRDNPASLPDCRRAALLFANSKNVWASRWGWYWLDRDRPSAQTAAGLRAAQERVGRLGNFGGTLEGRRYWRPWTDAEWLAWAQANTR